MGLGTGQGGHLRANESRTGRVGCWGGQEGGAGYWGAGLASGLLCWLVGLHSG